jgi:hypothetical protein
VFRQREEIESRIDSLKLFLEEEFHRSYEKADCPDDLEEFT